MNNIVKKIMRIIAAIIVVIIILYIANPPKEVTFAKVQQFPKLKNDKTMYLASTSWSEAAKAYKFAVEVDDFKGDILSAGTYQVTIPDSQTYKSVLPMRVDIYVGKNYDNVTELSELEPTLEVGGKNTQHKKYELTLKKGDYVYLIPQKSKYQYSGYIYLELQ